jgi:acetyltransferase-like isoleucine patch superfamily enzyme
MIYRDRWRKIRIQATNIEIGDDVKFGKNIDIQLHGDFSIGDRSRLGNNVRMRGRNITIGTDLYNSGGLEVGGGGNNHPHANLTIGDRCTVHREPCWSE